MNIPLSAQHEQANAVFVDSLLAAFNKLHNHEQFKKLEQSDISRYMHGVLVHLETSIYALREAVPTTAQTGPMEAAMASLACLIGLGCYESNDGVVRKKNVACGLPCVSDGETIGGFSIKVTLNCIKNDGLLEDNDPPVDPFGELGV